MEHRSMVRCGFTLRRSVFVSLLTLCCWGVACDSAKKSDASSAVRGPGFVEWKSGLERVGDRYVYDSDMSCLTEACLLNAYSRQSDTSQALVIHTTVGTGADDIWTANGAAGIRDVITYCVNTTTFTEAQIQALQNLPLEKAGLDWEQTTLLAIRHDYSQQGSGCTNTNANVDFNIRGVSGTSFFAAAFFPANARADRELLIDADAFTTSQNGMTLQGILTHEFGHVLGFRHEHVWAPDGGCGGEAETMALTFNGNAFGNGRAVTTYDESSVMGYPYCRTAPNQDTGFTISTKDREGAMALYGPSAALQTVIRP